MCSGYPTTKVATNDEEMVLTSLCTAGVLIVVELGADLGDSFHLPIRVPSSGGHGHSDYYLGWTSWNYRTTGPSWTHH